MQKIADRAIAASQTLNRYVERGCVVLMVLLVFDIWLGVLARYVMPLQLNFTEELARYLMIWMALLAVSSGISRRQHIGMRLLFEHFPARLRKWLMVSFDLLAFAFFAVILVHGIGMVESGFSRFTMIHGIPKAYPFIGVPLAAALACMQLLLVTLHDFFSTDGLTVAERVVL